MNQLNWQMINYHKYIFFRLYSWNLKSFGKNDLPALSALLELSLLMFLNLIAADLIFEKLTSMQLSILTTCQGP